jgi:hypothetical protein
MRPYVIKALTVCLKNEALPTGRIVHPLVKMTALIMFNRFISYIS